MNDYYVYVYIDPRNFEEFYFGKGKGNRKNAHLSDNTDSKIILNQAFLPAGSIFGLLHGIHPQSRRLF